MNLGPIFIHSSMRTGGTAFVNTFEQVEKALVFYDPLNPILQDYELAKSFSSSNWHSNHPENYEYFKNYFTIEKDEWYPFIPSPENFKFRNSSDEYKQELFIYLNSLIDAAIDQNRIPVFKFETLEGHVPFLREKFPNSINIGVIRNPKDQYLSWLEQLAFDNSFFFEKALSLIEGDPDFFLGGRTNIEKSNGYIFEIYYNALLSLRTELDFSIDLGVDSKQRILDKLKQSNVATNEHLDVFEQAFINLSSGIDAKTKFQKLLTKQIATIQQRDELTQQRDELTQQRDELTQQLSTIKSSRIWRLTKPWRLFGDVFKK